jgi:hypothetical protein
MSDPNCQHLKPRLKYSGDNFLAVATIDEWEKLLDKEGIEFQIMDPAMVDKVKKV